MDITEIKLLVKIASSVIVTFTTEENLKRISEIRKNIEDMSEDTVKFAAELLKDSAATARIIEQIFLDIMTTAGLETPTIKMTSRSLDKTVLAELRREIQTQFEIQRPAPKVIEDGKTISD